MDSQTVIAAARLEALEETNEKERVKRLKEIQHRMEGIWTTIEIKQDLLLNCSETIKPSRLIKAIDNLQDKYDVLEAIEASLLRPGKLIARLP